MDKKPFTESFVENKTRRVFDKDVANEELIWHRDKKDRVIYVIEAQGWKLQKDNELPINLVDGQMLYITKETYHRVIKGHGDLVIDIEE